MKLTVLGNISPEIFPSFHLISKDAVVNGKTIPNLEADLISHGPVMEISTSNI